LTFIKVGLKLILPHYCHEFINLVIDNTEHNILLYRSYSRIYPLREGTYKD